MVIPVVIGVLGAGTKGSVQGQEDLKISGRVETIQTTALFRSTRILKRVQDICCYGDSREKPSAKAGVKNSKEKKNYGWSIANELEIYLLCLRA